MCLFLINKLSMITNYKAPEFRVPQAPSIVLIWLWFQITEHAWILFFSEFQTGNNISVSSNPQGKTNNISV